MTTAALALMITSVTSVTILMLWCYYKVLSD